MVNNRVTAVSCPTLPRRAQELGLSEEVVEAVRRAASPARKAARLAGALRR